MDEGFISTKRSRIFNILIVDDDRGGARVLQEVMKDLQHRHELHFVWDGLEALDFLHRRGKYPDSPRPSLVLLDINMPRLGGLDTLAVIKGDPELRSIPVILLSTSNSPSDVRRGYQAHANGYVQKPTSLEGTVKLFQALESFWMEFVLLPARSEGPRGSGSKGEGFESQGSESNKSHTGKPIASPGVEASSQAKSLRGSPGEIELASRRSGCEEHDRLLDQFGVAVRGIIELHEQQFLAIVEGDSECHRFDLLIHMANEKKQLAKYGYLRHVDEHGCSNFDAVDNVRT
jgi:CheY-like chemotaxis protein